MGIRIKAAIILSLLMVSFAVKADDFKVHGKVIDKSTTEPISYATVSLEGTTIATITDEHGCFSLEKIPMGEHSLSVSFIGYSPKTVKVAKSETLNIHLEEEALQLEQVVVTSNRYATKKRESIGIVNLATPKLFENTASASSAEVLNFQTGMRVEWNCGNCGVPQLRINGLEGQYSQIAIDSRPVVSALTSVYGLEQYPASMIERVEVIRGGGSALYGSNAIGGVVNIITKEPNKNSILLSNTTSALGHGAVDINTLFNGSLVSNDTKTGIFLFGSIRDRSAYDRDGDGFSEIPELKSETIGFRAYQKTGTYSKITLSYHHINEFRRGGNLLDRPPHEADIAEQLNHKIDGGGLKYELLGKNYDGKLTVYSSVQNTNRESYFGTKKNLDAYGSTKDLVFNVGSQWDYSFKKLWFMPSTLSLGAEYTSDDLHDTMLGYGREIKQFTNTIGGFFQNEWRTEKASILVGARIDKHNLVKNVIVSPRLSARYSPTKELTMRANFSTGYRAPQTYDEDLHVAAVGGEIALITLSPDLKTERSMSVSGSIDYYKVFGKVQINVLAEGFYTNLKNVFTLEEKGHDEDGNLILERRNSKGAKVKGINFEVRLAIDQKFNVQSGYTFQKSLYEEPLEWSSNKNVEPTRKMFRSPDSYGYITLSYLPVKPLTISLSSTFTGRMYVQHFAGYIAEDRTEYTPKFADLGLRLAYNIKIAKSLNMEINGGVKNIFDSFQPDLDRGVDKDAKYIYGPALPRTIYGGIKLFI